MNTRNSLNLYTGKNAWNAEGTEQVQTTMQASDPQIALTTGTASTAPAAAKKPCNSCRNKRIAVFGAGLLLGVVLTWMFSGKKSAAA